MKKVILSMAIATMIFTTANSQDTKTQIVETVKQEVTSTVFGVRGNCGMCKATIEKAANGVDGVSSAVWDKETKKMAVSFDASKTNTKTIHNAIAASGYDTNLVKADEKSYSNLPGCCQYDQDMKLGEGTTTKEIKKGCGMSKEEMKNMDGKKGDIKHGKINHGKMDHSKMKSDSKESMSTVMAAVYICPMKCEGNKTYDKAGKCPKCGMNLKKVEGKKENSEHKH